MPKVASFVEAADWMNEKLTDFGDIDFDPFFWEQMDLLEELHAQYFKGEYGPEGSWAKLAPITIAKKGHGRKLFETGRLNDSLVLRNHEDAIREVDEDGLLFGTSVPYSIFHQTGTDTMPARVHVGITNAFQDNYIRELNQYISDNWNEDN